jgi:hypothetical protein
VNSGQLRGAILGVLHREWRKTGVMHVVVYASEVATEFSVDVKEVTREGEYLGEKGLLNPIQRGEAFQPTVQGIDFVEHPDVFPQHRSVIVVQAGRDVSIAASQIGSSGSFEASVGAGWQPDQIASLVGQLREQLNQVPDIEERVRREVLEDLETVTVQTRRANPNRHALWAIFQGLSETVHAAAALQQLWPTLERLGALLRPG